MNLGFGYKKNNTVNNCLIKLETVVNKYNIYVFVVHFQDFFVVKHS